jgi:membrane protease YdiL (CAAX protease family)
VSALFSILHFLKSPAHAIASEEVHWFSGFAILPQRFQQFEQPLLLLGGFTTLFLFGWVAGWAAIRTRSLALGMGFHAGMVFGKMGFNRVTTRPKGMRELLPWIGEDITVGIVGIGVLLLVGGLLWGYARYVRPKPS